MLCATDLVDLRGQEVKKNLTFFMGGTDTFTTINNSTGTEFQFDPGHVQYSAPVGEAIGFDLYNVNIHPFHIHINPFQLDMETERFSSEERFGEVYANLSASGWFNSGDWHDTLLIPDERYGSYDYVTPLYTSGNKSELSGKRYMRVLMQTDRFTGPSVVHCHILAHEDLGMMITVNFTGDEGKRYPRAYPTPEYTERRIDPTCYTKSSEVSLPRIIEATATAPRTPCEPPAPALPPSLAPTPGLPPAAPSPPPKPPTPGAPTESLRANGDDSMWHGLVAAGFVLFGLSLVVIGVLAWKRMQRTKVPEVGASATAIDTGTELAATSSQ